MTSVVPEMANVAEGHDFSRAGEANLDGRRILRSIGVCGFLLWWAFGMSLSFSNQPISIYYFPLNLRTHRSEPELELHFLRYCPHIAKTAMYALPGPRIFPVLTERVPSKGLNCRFHHLTE
jgi:hypothetical protein